MTKAYSYYTHCTHYTHYTQYTQYTQYTHYRSMFSLGWNWDPLKNFSASMAVRFAEFRNCNKTLFQVVSMEIHVGPLF